MSREKLDSNMDPDSAREIMRIVNAYLKALDIQDSLKAFLLPFGLVREDGRPHADRIVQLAERAREKG